ncbi:hypothetical protein NO263_14675 [Gluconacetobacter entanii]|uniref:ATP synthase F1 n=1 Tax=Gluconacetobacter entanii TaxID=108528 RepID=A0ABT3K8U0_9PROT|nr:ATP12 family protein [Gluconacetobacter entanii]MCW4591827.1 hypothetical protein [Gluconacetobacter entanii]MCW4595051.1 hypothetical protein [Gluconacetobacter entanii]NPC87940.1 hypothetical protein [Gluconacetobacter entanii]
MTDTTQRTSPTPDGKPARRRFWDSAAVVAEEAGYTVNLDGRPVRLPGRALLLVRSHALAQALAAEWAQAGGGKGGLFAPEDLPLTRIAGTMIERIAPDREATVAALLHYANGELLCYRATHPATLCERQAAQWTPWLDWLRERYGIALHTTEGVMPITQTPQALEALGTILRGYDDATLAALGVMVPAMKSLVLGIAVVTGACDAARAARVATLDERTQMEIWGRDAQQEAMLAVTAREVAEAASFLELACRG